MGQAEIMEGIQGGRTDKDRADRERERNISLKLKNKRFL